MDCRHHLSENIIVVGGNAGLPGLKWDHVFCHFITLKHCLVGD